MTPPIEEIARGLTEAQRRFLLSLPADGSWRDTTGEIARYGNGLRGFGQSGLVQGYYKETTRHRCTLLGQEVRTHLQSRQP